MNYYGNPNNILMSKKFIKNKCNIEKKIYKDSDSFMIKIKIKETKIEIAHIACFFYNYDNDKGNFIYVGKNNSMHINRLGV